MARPDPSDVAAYEAEFRQSHVGGPPAPLQGPIELCEYDPAWPRLYRREAARIRSVLGDRVVRLEHVGSTSVPGLAAKPILDLVLEVPDAATRPPACRPWWRPAMCCGSGSPMAPAPAVQGS